MLTNNGAGAFTSALAIANTESTGALAAADMNGDGKNDAIFVEGDNNGNSDIAVALSNGDGTFQTKTTTALAAGGSLTVADFNGDGKTRCDRGGGNHCLSAAEPGQRKRWDRPP